MIRKYCDLCGKEINNDPRNISYELLLRQSIPSGNSYSLSLPKDFTTTIKVLRYMDLCPSCAHIYETMKKD